MWAKQRGVAPKDIYHVCIMPCYDKKLEASRPEFRLDGLAAGAGTPEEESREVDLVLSSSEVLELASKVLPKVEDLQSIPRGAVETLWGETRDPQVLASVPEWGTAGTSGGFAEYVFQHLAAHVYNRDVCVREAGCVRAQGCVQLYIYMYVYIYICVCASVLEGPYEKVLPLYLLCVCVCVCVVHV